MKILEFQIKNIRGIRDMSIKPNGENIVIYGPNGSGKSSLIDGIDFLFTGEIHRLTGSGTEGITLKQHGANLYNKNEDSIVEVKLLNEDNKEIYLKRSLNNPSKLIYADKSKKLLKI